MTTDRSAHMTSPPRLWVAGARVRIVACSVLLLASCSIMRLVVGANEAPNESAPKGWVCHPAPPPPK